MKKKEERILTQEKQQRKQKKKKNKKDFRAVGRDSKRRRIMRLQRFGGT